MDDAVREAVRCWERSRGQVELLEAAIRAHRRAGLRVPADLLCSHPRWSRLAGFIRKWFRWPSSGASPAEIGAAERRLGGPLPLAVREFLELAGRCDDVFGRRPLWTIRGVPCKRLALEDGFLQLFEEDQAVFSWGVLESDFDQDDPPVVNMADGSPDETGVKVSELFLVTALWTRCARGPRAFQGCAADGADEAIQGVYGRLPLPSFLPSAGACPVEFFGDADTLLCRWDADISAAGRTREAYERVREVVLPLFAPGTVFPDDFQLG